MDCTEKQALSAIQEAEFILIGAGAGFSEAAGLTYSGARFEKILIKELLNASLYPGKTR